MPDQCLVSLRSKLVHKAIESQSASSPATTAVIFNNQRLSYETINNTANQIAAALRRFGVGPSQFVAVVLRRTPDLITILLAIMKTGATYVPIDPAFPRQRAEFIIDDLPICLVVLEDSSPSAWLSVKSKLITLSLLKTLASAEDKCNAEIELAHEDLSYVIYTSGTTGHPKGVAVTHGGLSNVVEALRSLFNVVPSDLWLAVTTISFDIAALELFLPLVSGATVLLAETEEAKQGDLLLKLACQFGATILQGTPALWRSILLAGGLPHTLRLGLCGGESMPVNLANELVADQSREIWNLYGPTETTIWSTAHRLDQRIYHDSPPIGKPIENTEVYVMDSLLRPVEAGVVGELFIGGLGLAREYIGQPDLTSQAFVPSPFPSIKGSRLYKTGDIARWNSDGNLEFVGRSDNQVKVRGFRIELEEVETALQRVPGFQQVVVITIRDNSGENSLVAYVVHDHTGVAELSTTRSLVLETLPDYMLPSLFVPVDSIPLTSAGKVDRQALRQMTTRGKSPSDPEPRTTTQMIVSKIWCNAFAIPTVNLTADFFDLGGHSLLATLIILRASDALGVDLTPRDLMDHSNIAAFSAVIDLKKQAPSNQL